VNLVRQTLKIVGREADRHGQFIEGSSAENIEQRQMAVRNSVSLKMEANTLVSLC